MDTELPEDIRLLQRTVRGFVEDVLAPCAKEIEDKDEIPRALIAKMGEAGLFGIGHEEALGGQGFGKLGYCVAVEQLARANASLWNVVGGSAGLCGTAISVGGPDEVRRRYLPDLFGGRKIGAYALSEPGATPTQPSLRQLVCTILPLLVSRCTNGAAHSTLVRRPTSSERSAPSGLAGAAGGVERRTRFTSKLRD